MLVELQEKWCLQKLHTLPWELWNRSSSPELDKGVKGISRMLEEFQGHFSHQTFHVKIPNLLGNVLWGLRCKVRT